MKTITLVESLKRHNDIAYDRSIEDSITHCERCGIEHNPDMASHAFLTQDIDLAWVCTKCYLTRTDIHSRWIIS
jgi:hypothetical protein